MRRALDEFGGLEEERVNRVWTVGGFVAGSGDER